LILQGSQYLTYFKMFLFDQIELYGPVLVRKKAVLDLVQMQQPLDENQQQTSGKQQWPPPEEVKARAGKEDFLHK